MMGSALGEYIVSFGSIKADKYLECERKFAENNLPENVKNELPFVLHNA
jgi:hypothetical protein